MEKLITVVMTEKQAKTIANAIQHYRSDSGADDVDLAIEILDQLQQ